MKRNLFATILFAFLAYTRPAAAAVTYQVQSLGAGDWTYTYEINSIPLLPNQFLAIFFDENLYANLIAGPAPNADWTVLALQPDPGIPAPGELDLIALIVSPAQPATFTATVTYLGNGAPGTQPYTVFDENFSPLLTGNTVLASTNTPPADIPEPSTLLLAGAALLALCLRRRPQSLLPLALLVSTFPAANAQMRVTARTLVSTARVSLTEFDYTYSVQVQNIGDAASQVTAVVTSFSPSTTVTRANLTFPDIPAGATATSTTTYTIRQDRTLPINQNLIRLAFSAISKPVANAGQDQLINVLNLPYDTLLFRAIYGRFATREDFAGPHCCLLTARGSYDPYGRRLTYRWTLLSKPSGSNTGNPTGLPGTYFTPDLPGDYLLSLTVNNGFFDSDPSYVRLSTIAVRPTANAGPNQTVRIGQNVQLDGTASTNPNARPITYAWTLLSSPPGTTPQLSNANSPRPTFTATLPGTYKFQLTVADGPLTSNPSTVTISTSNTPPIATVGKDTRISSNGAGMLFGNFSTDVDGDFLTYRWTVLSGPDLPVLAPVPNPELRVASDGVYHVQLMVSDGNSESIGTLLIDAHYLGYYGGGTVSPGLIALHQVPPPAVHFTMPASVIGYNAPHKAGSFLFDAFSSWNLGPIANYSWTLLHKPAGSTAIVSDPDHLAQLDPDVPGIYVAQVSVTEWGFPATPAAITFLSSGAPPVARTGQTQFIDWTSPTLISLDGSASYDHQSRPLSYRWHLLSQLAIIT